MKRRHFSIFKSSGESEKFSRGKLYASLRRSGLGHATGQSIMERVSDSMNEGGKTHDIYRKALRLVHRSSPMAAVHYSLKRALLGLGPSGHHFETFIARYFQEMGHDVLTCQTLAGRLVGHEVDVIAAKEGKRAFVECKFHNRQGIKNDVKIALYVKARRDDLKEGPEGKNLDGFYIASNTSFSRDAMTYAQGSNIKLLGLNAPEEKPFMEEIKSFRLYPVTSLRSINNWTKSRLLNDGIILARDVLTEGGKIARLGLSEREIEKLFAEARLLQRGNP